jgi:hypothetical protein
MLPKMGVAFARLKSPDTDDDAGVQDSLLPWTGIDGTWHADMRGEPEIGDGPVMLTAGLSGADRIKRSSAISRGEEAQRGESVDASDLSLSTEVDLWRPATGASDGELPKGGIPPLLADSRGEGLNFGVKRFAMFDGELSMSGVLALLEERGPARGDAVTQPAVAMPVGLLTCLRRSGGGTGAESQLSIDFPLIIGLGLEEEPKSNDFPLLKVLEFTCWPAPGLSKERHLKDEWSTDEEDGEADALLLPLAFRPIALNPFFLEWALPQALLGALM